MSVPGQPEPKPVAEIELLDGTRARIFRLTPESYERVGDALTRIHNEIPFQNWTPEEVYAEEIEGRKFLAKWELSHFAVIDDDPVALNLAYERPAAVAPYDEDCVYMHRFAVHPGYRRRWLGRLFHAHALDVAFSRRPRFLRSVTPRAFGQTQATSENSHVLRFYLEGCGFKPVGFMY